MEGLLAAMRLLGHLSGGVSACWRLDARLDGTVKNDNLQQLGDAHYWCAERHLERWMGALSNTLLGLVVKEMPVVHVQGYL